MATILRKTWHVSLFVSRNVASLGAIERSDYGSKHPLLLGTACKKLHSCYRYRDTALHLLYCWSTRLQVESPCMACCKTTCHPPPYWPASGKMQPSSHVVSTNWCEPWMTQCTSRRRSALESAHFLVFYLVKLALMMPINWRTSALKKRFTIYISDQTENWNIKVPKHYHN